jgi:hypothetical protein
MDIEDVATIDMGVNNETERLQQRSRSPLSQIRPVEHQVCPLLEGYFDRW